MNQLILGIDPGFSGAMAVYDPLSREIIDILDMPLLEPIQFGSKDSRKHLDPQKIRSFVKNHPNINLAVLESVHAMPHQGVSSTFRFGEGYGILQGILSGFEFRLLKPPPAVWKLTLGVTFQKASSLSLVCKEFPKDQWRFQRKKDDGRAEALLLALFGAKSLGFTVSKAYGGDINGIL